MHEAELVLQYPDATAHAVHGALSPETEAQVPKTRANVTLQGRAVIVRIHADDLAALRAALNSHLRWADAAARSARAAQR